MNRMFKKNIVIWKQEKSNIINNFTFTFDLFNASLLN